MHIFTNFILPLFQTVSVIVVIGVILVILFHDPSGTDNGGY